MKQLILLTFLATLLFISGCTPQPSPQEEPKIDPSLPKVSVNGHLQSMTSIAFEWKPSTDKRVKGYYIYRSNPEDKEGKLSRHSNVPSRFVSHYTDTKLTPNTTYIYRISAFNEKGQESEASKTYRVTTKPLLNSVSFFDSIGNLPRMAKLIWRPHDNAGVKGYILERQTIENPEWKIIANIDNRLQAEYIDYDLEDNRVYKYRLRALTYQGIESTPSDLAKVVTKPLPKAVQGLRATHDEAKKITVSWDASLEKDIAYYNVYRSSYNTGSYSYYMKLNETSFSDTTEKDGFNYYYKVAAVDLDELESPKQSVAVHGNSLAKPMAPTLLDATVKGNSAVLTWKNNDTRTQTYTVLKNTKESWISTSTQRLTGIKETQYTVKDLLPDTAYSFQVIAVDSHNIASEPTKQVDVLIASPK